MKLWNVRIYVELILRFEDFMSLSNPLLRVKGCLTQLARSRKSIDIEPWNVPFIKDLEKKLI